MAMQQYIEDNSLKNGRNHLDSFESWVALKKAV